MNTLNIIFSIESGRYIEKIFMDNEETAKVMVVAINMYRDHSY